MGFIDAELNSFGRLQATCLRDALAGETLDAVYSSDLKRCLQTAEIVIGERNLEITACSELRECNYGSCEGMTIGEIAERYPDVAAMCTAFNPKIEFPDGESFQEFQRRACGFLKRLEEHRPEDTVLIVSHGGPLGILLCHLLEIDTDNWLKFNISNASLTTVNTSPRGASLACLNDTSHLAKIR